MPGKKTKGMVNRDSARREGSVSPIPGSSTVDVAAFSNGLFECLTRFPISPIYSSRFAYRPEGPKISAYGRMYERVCEMDRVRLLC